MRNLKLMAFLILQSALLFQAGCSHFKPDKIQDNEIPEGAGLFSGEKGYFEL